jgi:hypothetical protein
VLLCYFDSCISFMASKRYFLRLRIIRPVWKLEKFSDESYICPISYTYHMHTLVKYVGFITHTSAPVFAFHNV